MRKHLHLLPFSDAVYCHIFLTMADYHYLNLEISLGNGPF